MPDEKSNTLPIRNWDGAAGVDVSAAEATGYTLPIRNWDKWSRTLKRLHFQPVHNRYTLPIRNWDICRYVYNAAYESYRDYGYTLPIRNWDSSLTIKHGWFDKACYTLPIRNWDDFFLGYSYGVSGYIAFMLYLTYKELRRYFCWIISLIKVICYTLPIRNWDVRVNLSSSMPSTVQGYTLPIRNWDFSTSTVCPVSIFNLLYLTYKELRLIKKTSSAQPFLNLMLYLTYKELLVCLCLSPRAPKKRANSCLLGSMRICSPFVL